MVFLFTFLVFCPISNLFITPFPLTPPSTLERSQAYESHVASEKKLYGSKIYLYSALVIDAYESIHADGGEAKVVAKKPFKSVAWLRKDEVIAGVEPSLGELLKFVL